MFSIRFVWEKLKGRRWMIILGLIVSVIYSATVVINPYLSKILVDKAIKAPGGADSELLVKLLIIMSAIVFFRTVILFIRKVLFEMSSQMMLKNIRLAIFNNIQHQELGFFDKIKAGDLVTRSLSDVGHTRHFVAYTLFTIVDTVVLFLASVTVLLFVSPELTLSLLAVVPILGATSYLYSKKVAPIYRSIRKHFAQLNIAAQENIEGNRVVKAFARESYEIEKFQEASEKYKEENLKAAYAWQKVVPIIEFLAQSLTFITLLVGGILVIKKPDFSIGDLSMFTALTWALALPMRNVSTILNNYQNFVTSTVKVIELCEASPLISSRHDAIKTEEPLKGKIEFKNVSFRYSKNGDKVLDNISFVVEPGETVAIMGATGSGKTTIVNLISRFYDVSEGQILLDDVDVRLRRLEDIRGSISIATQDVFLFSDTVENNIAYSQPDMATEQIHEYAKLAAADEFIKKMESSYETIIGERGVGISGGQKQRLALARAMAEEAPILILDDTTSAVDMETEKYIQNSLATLPVKTTKIIIAQRISSVRHADKIMILQNGKIEIGTHDTLASTNAYYRGICELQDVSDLPKFVGGDNNG